MATLTASDDAARIIKRRRFTRMLKRDFSGWLGIAILVVAVLSALFAGAFAPHDPLVQDIPNRFLPPAFAGGSADYLLGTDQLGRDILSRLLYAGQISIIIGLVTALLAGILGATLGIIAGWREGWLGSIILRIVDIQTAFPFLVVAIAVVAVVGTSIPTLIATLTVWTWVPFAKVAQSSVLKLKHQEFIQAARVSGVPPIKILARHVLPNIFAPLLVIWTFAIAQVIVAESGLSFLGLGIQPPTPTWGTMISQGRDTMDVAWWTVVVPAVAIVLVVLAVNLVGDWLRDRFDPQLNA